MSFIAFSGEGLIERMGRTIFPAWELAPWTLANSRGPRQRSRRDRIPIAWGQAEGATPGLPPDDEREERSAFQAVVRELVEWRLATDLDRNKTAPDPGETVEKNDVPYSCAYSSAVVFGFSSGISTAAGR
ncbi:MAG: hypothetical protein P8Z74_18335 [Acidobacteriota bacterium]